MYLKLNKPYLNQSTKWPRVSLSYKEQRHVQTDITTSRNMISVAVHSKYRRALVKEASMRHLNTAGTL